MTLRRSRYRIVIIGGGIMGLSTAYHLCRLGIDDVLVVERGYLCGGASGRNGGGVRAQFSSETNIKLMQRSLQICKEFAAHMGINVWFRQGGYLFLTRTAERAEQLEQSVKLQNQCGLKTKLMPGRQAQQIVPELNTDGVVLASFNHEDAVVFPWPFLWGYAKAAKDLGAEIVTFADVVAIKQQGDKIQSLVLRKTNPLEVSQWEHLGQTHAPPVNTETVHTPSFSELSRKAQGERVTIECDEVICCAGAWSPEIAAMVGVSLPNHPHRHEICSTEPLKPWLGPLVADLTDGLYFSQSARGEIVGGIGQDPVPHGINQRSSAEFLSTYARSLVRAVPKLADVKVLRQWAGCYDLTPDGNPIVGRVDSPTNFILSCGFMGHGFMMAPVMGELLAQYIHTQNDTELFDRWALRRFREGRLLKESMIIG